MSVPRIQDINFDFLIESLLFGPELEDKFSNLSDCNRRNKGYSQIIWR